MNQLAVTSVAATTEHAQSPAAAVTGGTPAAERKRQQRERERLARQPPFFERTDWSLFINPRTLSQKAGCQPGDIRRLVLRELVDNALDAGATAVIERVGNGWGVADDGPGLDPDDVPRLFSVNRPLVSSKQLRRTSRGMVGNGLRAVMGALAAFGGTLTVITRGRRIELAVDRENGLTVVTGDSAVEMTTGLTVCITLDGGDDDYGDLARETVRIADFGRTYDGPSSPYWYSPRDLRDLMLQAPAETTVADVARWFGIIHHDRQPAHGLDLPAVTELHGTLRRFVATVPPSRLGDIGPDAYEDGLYHKVTGFTRATTEIPYVVEAWATCHRSTQRGAGSAKIRLLLNRTVSLSRLSASSSPDGLLVQGCGLLRSIKGKTGHYDIVLSVIAPFIELATDGKEPALSPFGEGIVAAIGKACARAHNAMDKPPGSMSIVEAAERVMPTAYRIASANGTLPANARQIFYAARPFILELTGRRELSDSYFTQNVLPDYIDNHPESHEWDVVYDDRGSFTEPHTGHNFGLGTVAVRQYLGERPAPPAAASIAPGLMKSTTGPENRYRNVLFVEKEGFNALLAHALIKERFDVAITSTKGMSNTALRQLLDGLVARGMERCFVLHDFDASGFSIFGTLGTDSRRYTFTNRVTVVDLGLRLSDINEMGLDDEPYEPSFWDKRRETLREHGASYEEIVFLSDRRVELNAMPSDVFISFLERKLDEHGVGKLVPDPVVLQAHAYDIILRATTNKMLETLRPELACDALAVPIPDDLQQQVAAVLCDKPEWPWDLAVASIVADMP